MNPYLASLAVALLVVPAGLTAAHHDGFFTGDGKPITSIYSTRVGEGPFIAYVEYGFVGVGGEGDPDCRDLDGQTRVFVISYWFDVPGVVFKTLGSRVPITEEPIGMEAPPEVEEVCRTLASVPTNPGGFGTADPYANEPPFIGVGPLALRGDELFYITQQYDSTTLSSAITGTTCQIDPATAEFRSLRSRGAANLEQALPSEEVRGTLDFATCLSLTPVLAGNWGAGQVNLNGGSLGTHHFYTCTQDPAPDNCLEMEPGLWGFCVRALWTDPANNMHLWSDYTWLWIEGLALGTATQSLLNSNWDGEDYYGGSGGSDGLGNYFRDCDDVDGTGNGHSFPTL